MSKEMIWALIGVGIAAGLIFIILFDSITKSNAEKKQRINGYKNELERLFNELNSQPDNIKRDFSLYGYDFNKNYSSVYESLGKNILTMKEIVHKMRDVNRKLVFESKKEDQTAAIDEAEERVSSAAVCVTKECLINAFNHKNYGVDAIIKNFFAATSEHSSYNFANKTLEEYIRDLESTKSNMRAINSRLSSEFPKTVTTESYEEVDRAITSAKRAAEEFKLFGKRVNETSFTNMIAADPYGKINTQLWDKVSKIKREDAVRYISSCEEYLKSTNFVALFNIDLEMAFKCVWFFATEKTFSAKDFDNAKFFFKRVFKKSHADFFIAELYAKRKMGGEDVIREEINDLLKDDPGRCSLPLLASALMWMNAYRSEQAVLQYMLTNGMEMSAKLQERLHSLTNGGGKAPSGFDVQSSAETLYFDVSSLSWKDDEFTGLFENLAFQEKVLTYSLALRDENKDLFIPRGINMPDSGAVINKLKAVLADEYDSQVLADAMKCIALSGSGQEKVDGILVYSNECKQMGILVSVVKIGKKLNIKFYTLFRPIDSDLTTQKQQALSMAKKLSPTVTMWENSMKDTILMAIEQLLNSNVQTSDTTSSVDTSSAEVVF